jgi:hypothetical protein
MEAGSPVCFGKLNKSQEQKACQKEEREVRKAIHAMKKRCAF